MCAGATTAQQSLAPVAQHTPQPIAPAATTRITLMVYYARRFDRLTELVLATGVLGSILKHNEFLREAIIRQCPRYFPSSIVFEIRSTHLGRNGIFETTD